MNDIRKAINYIQNMDLSKFKNKQEAEEVIDFITEILNQHLSSEMTGAIEFLRKVNAIHKSCKYDEKLKCGTCPINCMCGTAVLERNEFDLVRNVMDYQIKEETYGTIH